MVQTTSSSGIPARILLLAGCVACACFGQGDRGLLTGLVKDPTGGAIAGAAIRAVHVATNVATASETNAYGNYSLPFLVPGEYTVTANKTGFRQFERSGVTIAVNDRLTLNISMEVGSVSEKMDVRADAELLETTS